MSDVVIMGRNGELAVAVPLYRAEYSDEIASLEGQALMLMSKKPWAYVVDMDSKTCPILNAEIVERQCEFLGKL